LRRRKWIRRLRGSRAKSRADRAPLFVNLTLLRVDPLITFVIMEQEYLRTLVQLLVETGNRELAAVMVDGSVDYIREDQGYVSGLIIDVPTQAYDLVSGNPGMKQALIKAGKTVANGRMYDGNGGLLDDPEVKLRVMLMPVEDHWKEVVRDLIVNYKGTNQGTISKLMAERDRRKLIAYNEANYASQSEIRIAQEFEQREVLFFPLAMAIRADTGENWRDHREPDFLVCSEGTWGILEVSYHPDRFEKDAEKDVWWKKSGILCVQHYTAERCFRESARVVDEFLTILAKHKR
jgi:hypothetical protein